MAYGYDKAHIKEQITFDNIIELLNDFGGEPLVRGDVIVSRTICHHSPDEDCSHKLYYYENSGLFKCYTGGCAEDTFDIFQLVIKVQEIQKNKKFDLNDAVLFIAARLGISGEEFQLDEFELEDWKKLNNYARIQQIKDNFNPFQFKVLPEYHMGILTRFSYPRIANWEREGMTDTVLKQHMIGYYPGEEQITIPHFDINGRLIGIRGRSLIKDEAEKYGKYRPLKINQVLYNHPLGTNLYNLNHSKENIKNIEKAIVFESEKSTLLFASYFGIENDISVACCGSSFSAYQLELLVSAGAKEITIAFDRQFQEIGDEEFKHLTNNLTKINEKFKNFVNISFIFDSNMITGYKDAPIDCGPEIFLQLYKERITL